MSGSGGMFFVMCCFYSMQGSGGASKEGAEEVFLHVRPENLAARALYMGFGFRLASVHCVYDM